MDQFILFGDSLTQQAFSPEGTPFGPALTNAYIRKLDIVNRGFSGYNTTQALSILPQILPTPSQAKIRFLVIFFGANDARLPNTPGGRQQHVPLDTFKDNLRSIATHPCVTAHRGVKRVLVTPPPVDERMLEDADEEKYGRRMLRRTAWTTYLYSRAVRHLGRELGVPVVDLWSAVLNDADMGQPTGGLAPGSKSLPSQLEKSLRDGLHFTSNGYRVLYEELMAVIGEMWPEELPERLSFVVPAWDDEGAWKGRSDGEEADGRANEDGDGGRDEGDEGVKRRKTAESL